MSPTPGDDKKQATHRESDARMIVLAVRVAAEAVRLPRGSPLAVRDPDAGSRPAGIAPDGRAGRHSTRPPQLAQRDPPHIRVEVRAPCLGGGLVGPHGAAGGQGEAPAALLIPRRPAP